VTPSPQSTPDDYVHFEDCGCDKCVPRDKCGMCGGSGWTIGTGSAHDPNCDGTCVNCPIPVPIQVECEHCHGQGYIYTDVEGGSR